MIDTINDLQVTPGNTQLRLHAVGGAVSREDCFDLLVLADTLTKITDGSYYYNPLGTRIGIKDGNPGDNVTCSIADTWGDISSQKWVGFTLGTVAGLTGHTDKQYIGQALNINHADTTYNNTRSSKGLIASQFRIQSTGGTDVNDAVCMLGTVQFGNDGTYGSATLFETSSVGFAGASDITGNLINFCVGVDLAISGTQYGFYDNALQSDDWAFHTTSAKSHFGGAVTMGGTLNVTGAITGDLTGDVNGETIDGTEVRSAAALTSGRVIQGGGSQAISATTVIAADLTTKQGSSSADVLTSWVGSGNVLKSSAIATANVVTAASTPASANEILFSASTDKTIDSLANSVLNATTTTLPGSTLNFGSGSGGSTLYAATDGNCDVELYGAFSFQFWTNVNGSSVGAFQMNNNGSFGNTVSGGGLYCHNAWLSATLFIAERASAQADISGYGQVWMRSSDSRLMYTNDSGTDYLVDLTAA
jgi:hypothetical protein